MYDTSVRQHYKSEHSVPCRNQTPLRYEWEIVESDVKPEQTTTLLFWMLFINADDVVVATSIAIAVDVDVAVVCSLTRHFCQIWTLSFLRIVKCNHYLHKWSLVTRKPVFGVCAQLRLKPACSADETSYGLEISAIASRGIILSRQRTTKVLIRLRGCAGWPVALLFAYNKSRFSHDAAQLIPVIIRARAFK